MFLIIILFLCTLLLCSKLFSQYYCCVLAQTPWKLTPPLLFVWSWTLEKNHRGANPVSPVESSVPALPCTNGGNGFTSFHATKLNWCTHSQFALWCTHIYIPPKSRNRNLIWIFSSILRLALASTRELQWQVKPWFIRCPSFVASNQVISTMKHKNTPLRILLEEKPIHSSSTLNRISQSD